MGFRSAGRVSHDGPAFAARSIAMFARCLARPPRFGQPRLAKPNETRHDLRPAATISKPPQRRRAEWMRQGVNA